MNTLTLRRRASPVEAAGPWLALAAGLSLLSAFVQVNFLDGLLDWPPKAEAWTDVYEAWVLAIAGFLPIAGVCGIAGRFLPSRRLIRWPLLAVAVFASVWLGWLVQSSLAMACGCEQNPRAAQLVQQHTLLVTATLIAFYGEYRRSFLRAAESLHRSEVEQLRMRGEFAASQLQLLQAQIEPHFLFNSLANVRRLLRTDGVAGRAMLADLLRYLESALPRLRDERPTLAREVEVTRAFLAVHQVRMGARLRVEFDVDGALGHLVVPPMMLITLVENALKHGLAPLLEGGGITVSAALDMGTLRLSVADTGRGLGASLGTGTGLANIRARLRSMYGDDAALRLRVNEPRGVVALLELPTSPG